MGHLACAWGTEYRSPACAAAGAAVILGGSFARRQSHGDEEASEEDRQEGGEGRGAQTGEETAEPRGHAGALAEGEHAGGRPRAAPGSGRDLKREDDLHDG